MIISNKNIKTVFVFKIGVQKSKAIDFMRCLSPTTTNFANFTPAALAVNEERNDCYVRSVCFAEDKVYVFDMTYWKLRNVWDVTKCGSRTLASIDYFSGIAFNKSTGLLYLPAHESNGFHRMDPTTGILQPTLLFPDPTTTSRSLSEYSVVALWSGNLTQWGACLAVCFSWKNTVHVYSCTALNPLLTFTIDGEVEAHSIQCYHDEFYVGGFRGSGISVYSLTGIFQRKVSYMALTTSCFSIRAPSQAMVVLEYCAGEIAVIE